MVFKSYRIHQSALYLTGEVGKRISELTSRIQSMVRMAARPHH